MSGLLLLVLMALALPGPETSVADIQPERKQLEAELRARPGDTGVRLELARLLASVGDPEARRCFEDAVRRAPADPNLRSEFADYLWSVGDAEAADDQIARLLKLAKPKPGFRKFYGLKLFDQRNFRMASVQLSLAAKEAPGDDEVLFALGCSELENGRFPEAESALRRATEIAPRRAEPHHVLGKLQLLQGRSAEALVELDLAIKLDPDSAGSWIDLGNARRQNGDPPGAEEAFRRAIGLAPRSAAPRSALAALLSHMGHREEAASEAAIAGELFARAEAQTEAARAATVKMQSARAALAAGRWTVAEEAFRAMPESAESLRGLAQALSGQNRHREAAEVFAHAVTLAPDDASLVYSLARERASSP